MSETFGEWELLTRLGQNELGETHLALRRSDQLKAVLKTFSADVTGDLSFYGPLKLELTLASKLKHPAAAAVLEQGDVNGVGFAALEHVDGISLTKLGERAQATNGWPLSMDRAVEVMRPVLEALGAAHALSPPLLHRDVVPQNVRVTCEGRVVVTDFGLGRARLRAGTGTAGMRRAYVSPEQARGHATDARSEVFAAGLILFELVCGRLPAQGGAGEVISRIATGELDAPLAVNPMLDDAAVAVLARALAIRPEDRFATARDFFEALAPWTSGTKEEPLGAWVTRLDGVKVAPPAAAPKLPQAEPTPNVVTATTRALVPRKRRPLVWAGGAVLGLSLAGFILEPYSEELREVFGRRSTVDPLTDGRPLELLSIPSGATVYVDGVQEERRTPLTLHIPKDELRNIMLKKQGAGVWSGHVSNTRRLEVTIIGGAIEEERYEGARPGSKEGPKVEAAAVEPIPVEPTVDEGPKPEVVFDAEAPSVEVVLTSAHSVRGDLGQEIEIAAGATGVLEQGAMLYLSPPTPNYGRNVQQSNRMKPMPSPTAFTGSPSGSYRVLNLFAMLKSEDGIEVFDLSERASFSKAGTYYLFSPTESAETHSNSASAVVDEEPILLTAKHLLRVDQDDSFLIRVVDPKLTYRVQLTRADGLPGPLPVVIAAMRPDKDLSSLPRGAYQNSLRDGKPVPSGQTVVRSGVHTFSGARNVWFTVITAAGVTPPPVKLSVKLASAKKLR
jgi:hypothetical protein